MKTFKELLAEDYKDGMSNEKIEELVCLKYTSIYENELKLKNAISNANKEASDYKRKYQDTLTEEEQKRVAREEEIKKILDERDSLKREKSISDYYANFISLGYDENLARETANALFENDHSKVFENQKLFLKNQADKAKAEAMRNNPIPPATDPKIVTKEDFNKMSMDELLTLQKQDPGLFKKLNEE